MIKIVNASALAIPLLDKSVHSIVTSPPYFGLRNYSGKQMVDWPAGNYSPCTGASACIEVPAMRCGLGSEPTVEAYIFHTLLVLRECKRALRDDGVVWWNLGDSFSSDGKWGGYTGGKHVAGLHGKTGVGRDRKTTGISSGQLIGIPARFMLAAQADGWIVRNDCVWHKKAPMPESISGARWVKHKIKVDGGKRGREKSRIGAMPDKPQQDHDGKNFKPSAKYIDCPGCDECKPNDGFVLKRGSWRHTRAHEFVFQLTKQMSYWANGDAVREKANYPGDDRKARSNGTHKTMPTELQNGIRPGESNYDLSGRNPRSVLSPAPSNYRGAHFATFPPELIRNLIKSSTPKKCCAECGAGYAPVVEIERWPRGDAFGVKFVDGHDHGQGGSDYFESKSSIFGYRPTCSCNIIASVHGICLDPFIGSGTTLQVCCELGVSGIGLDISFSYLHEQATRRAEKRIPQGIVDRFVDELPLFSGQQNISFERLFIDGRNGVAKLKKETVELCEK